jgi:predicted nucleic acid-binding protein
VTTPAAGSAEGSTAQIAVTENLAKDGTKDVTRGQRPPWTVVDATVLAVALTDDGPDGDRARQRMAGCTLAAPSIVDLEVLAVWHRGAASGAVPQRRIDLAMADLARIPLTRVNPLEFLPSCWDRLGGATAADAAYLALAEALDAPLLTADPRLARAGSRVRVELLR